MPRTTMDIDAPILDKLKKLQAKEQKSLGRLISDLLAQALADTSMDTSTEEFAWSTQPMGARIDISDKDAVWRAMEERNK